MIPAPISQQTRASKMLDQLGDILSYFEQAPSSNEFRLYTLRAMDAFSDGHSDPSDSETAAGLRERARKLAPELFELARLVRAFGATSIDLPGDCQKSIELIEGGKR